MIANLHNADISRPLLDVIARLRELGHTAPGHTSRFSPS